MAEVTNKKPNDASVRALAEAQARNAQAKEHAQGTKDAVDAIKAAAPTVPPKTAEALKGVNAVDGFDANPKGPEVKLKAETDFKDPTKFKVGVEQSLSVAGQPVKLAADVSVRRNSVTAEVKAAREGEAELLKNETTGAVLKSNTFVGAEGEATVSAGPDKVGIEGKAFIGGRIGLSAGVEGELGKVEGKAELTYGLGVEGKAKVSFDDGKLKVTASLGATVGLGTKLSGTVEVDPKKVAEDVKHVAELATGTDPQSQVWKAEELRSQALTKNESDYRQRTRSINGEYDQLTAKRPDLAPVYDAERNKNLFEAQRHNIEASRDINARWDAVVKALRDPK